MLTQEEYAACATEMQEIWKRELMNLETTAVQSVINGDTKSIEEAKIRAKEYKSTKHTVDQCINILLKYIKPSEPPKTRNT